MPLEYEDRPAIAPPEPGSFAARPLRTKLRVAGVVLTVLLLVVWGLLLLIGVWLPDVILQSTNTLAEASAKDGHCFRVIQYWNNGDFYSTKLRHFWPNGTMEEHVLDGDDFKEWTVPLMIDPTNHTASVTLAGRPAKIIPW